MRVSEGGGVCMINFGDTSLSLTLAVGGCIIVYLSSTLSPSRRQV